MTAAGDIEYYAVPDPRDPAVMTYWRRTTARGLQPWPPKARYGPTLLRRDVPAGLHGRDKAEWVNGWYRQHVDPWRQSVLAALDADPEACAARFAAFTTRCCCCGRRLTDPASKTYGIGPECRSGVPDGLLAALAAAVAKAHGEHVSAGGQP